MIATLATIETLIATAVLVFFEYVRSRVPNAYPRGRAIAKLTASLGFIVVGAHAIGAHADPPHAAFATLAFFGLVLGALGDAALLGTSPRALLGGILAFLLGHLAYIIGIAYLLGPQYWIAAAGWLGLVPIVVALVAYDWLKPKLFGPFRTAVGAYIIVITTMAVGALAVERGGLIGDTAGGLFALGAMLFFASDLAVARERFVQRDFRNKLFGLPAYFVGQLLIAWAIALP